jgi:hypothetical protein
MIDLKLILVLAGIVAIILAFNSGNVMSMVPIGGVGGHIALYDITSNTYTLQATGNAKGSDDFVCAIFQHSDEPESHCTSVGSIYSKDFCHYDVKLNYTYFKNNYDAIGTITCSEFTLSNISITKTAYSGLVVCAKQPNAVTYLSRSFTVDVKLIPKLVVQPNQPNNTSNGSEPIIDDGAFQIPCIIGCSNIPIAEENSVNIGLAIIGVVLIGVSVFILRKR